jgi:hypothetical protein
LFCTKGEGGEGRALLPPLPGPLEGVGTENQLKLYIHYRIQNKPAAKLMYIKLPM